MNFFPEKQKKEAKNPEKHDSRWSRLCQQSTRRRFLIKNNLRQCVKSARVEGKQSQREKFLRDAGKLMKNFRSAWELER